MLWTLNLQPHDRVESTLSIGYSDIAKAVSRYLGFGRSVPTDSDDLATVNAVINRGLRQAYFPPPLPGERNAHEWRFLRPTITIQTASGQGDYEMPADFGSLWGDITFAEAEAYYTIDVVGEGRIRERRMYTHNADRPLLAAVRPVAQPHPSHGTRWELMLWPTPQGVYHLSFSYRVLPNVISTTNEYPYGGMTMGELVLESCLAIAEEDEDDVSAGGTHRKRFLELLVAAVMHERQAHTPGHLGYNGDCSGMRGSYVGSSRDDWRWNTGYTVSYTG